MRAASRLATVVLAIALVFAPAGGASARQLRVMTWNIKSGDLASLGKIAAEIRKHRPDVVALQEVDDRTVRSGRVSQANRLGRMTSMRAIFRGATPMDGGRYGLALLSRLPVKDVRRVKLTSKGEPRILVVARVEIEPGEVAPIAVTHLGLEPGERAVQAGEILGALEPDALLLGDLNEGHRAAGVRALKARFRDLWPSAGAGNGKTFPSDAPVKRIDYVLAGKGWKHARAHVPASTESDHRAIVVDVER
jgi:endonuclease/exonuclease/phosphatase family metal-dependent hydrolase